MKHRTFTTWACIILLFASFAGIIGWGAEGRLIEAAFAWLVGVGAAYGIVLGLTEEPAAEDG